MSEYRPQLLQTQAFDSLNRQIDQLRADLATAQTELLEMREHYRAAKASLATARQEVVNEQASHEHTHKMLHERLATVKAERDSLSEYIARPSSAHQSRLDELQGALTLEAARHADTSAALKYATEQMGAERAAHEQTRKALEESGAKLTEARTKYRNQWEAAQMSEQSAQALEFALESTRAELAKAEARVKQLESELEETENEGGEWKNRVESAEELVKQLQARWDEHCSMHKDGCYRG